MSHIYHRNNQIEKILNDSEFKTTICNGDVNKGYSWIKQVFIRVDVIRYDYRMLLQSLELHFMSY